MLITVESAIAAGCCEESTKAFAAEFFPGRESATLEEIEAAAVAAGGDWLERYLKYAPWVTAEFRAAHT